MAPSPNPAQPAPQRSGAAPGPAAMPGGAAPYAAAAGRGRGRPGPPQGQSAPPHPHQQQAQPMGYQQQQGYPPQPPFNQYAPPAPMGYAPQQYPPQGPGGYPYPANPVAGPPFGRGDGPPPQAGNGAPPPNAWGGPRFTPGAGQQQQPPFEHQKMLQQQQQQQQQMYRQPQQMQRIPQQQQPTQPQQAAGRPRAPPVRERKIASLTRPTGEAIKINSVVPGDKADADKGAIVAKEASPAIVKGAQVPAVSKPAETVAPEATANAPVTPVAPVAPVAPIAPTPPAPAPPVRSFAAAAAKAVAPPGSPVPPAVSSTAASAAPPTKRLAIIKPPANKALVIKRPPADSQPPQDAKPVSSPSPVTPVAAAKQVSPSKPEAAVTSAKPATPASPPARAPIAAKPSPTTPVTPAVPVPSSPKMTTGPVEPAKQPPSSSRTDTAALAGATVPAVSAAAAKTQPTPQVPSTTTPPPPPTANGVKSTAETVVTGAKEGDVEAKEVKASPVTATPEESAPVTDTLTPATGKTADQETSEAAQPAEPEEEDVAPSPPRRQRPSTMTFGDGERRCFPRTFIMAMRDFSPQVSTQKILDVLTKASLVKPENGGMLDSPGAGGDGGRDDPRGREAPMRGAQMNAGADMSNMRQRSGGAPPASMSFPGSGFPANPRAGPGAGGPAMPGMGMGGAGGYDSFDLSSARSKAPPPPAPGAAPVPAGGPGGAAGGRMGDPRGTGQLAPLPGGDAARGGRGGGHGRFDGPTRNGHMGPLDPYEMFAPVEKLSKGENAWVPQKEEDMDVLTATVKKVRSLLNKLTLEKFDKIFGQIIALDISSLHVLTGIVSEIFEKTLGEPMFAGMYAELCRRLNSHYDGGGQKYEDDEGKVLTFRRVLLTNCQKEFTRFAESQAAEAEAIEAETKGKDAKAGDSAATKAKEEVVKEEKEAGKEAEKEEDAAPAKPLTPAEEAAKAKLDKAKAVAAALTAKKRMLGNVRFIGELYKKDLLTERIVHKNCIQTLLQIGLKAKEPDVLEALCNILSRTGKKLSDNTHEETKKAMNLYFSHLNALSNDKTLSARMRFMLQDLAEQRANGWNLRREEQGAKTIAEIKADLDKEERAKEQAQASRGRGGGGGGGRSGGGFNRPPPPRHNAPAMTMAPSQARTPSGSTSRQSSILEKYGKRTVPSAGGAASGGAAPAAPQRLGPNQPSSGGQWSNASGSGSRLGGRGRSATGPPAGAGGGGAMTGAGNAFAALAETSEPASNDVRAMRPGAGGRWGVANRGVSTDSSASQPTAAPVEQEMEHDKLKRKTKSYVSEFWTLNDMKEVRECLVEELKTVNFKNFVTETLKFCLESKPADRVKTVPMLVGVIGNPIPLQVMKDGFSPVIEKLADHEVDDPKAANTLALFLGALATSGKFGDGDAFGLEFLKSAVSEIDDKKKIMKLIILTFSELDKGLKETVADDTMRQAKVSKAYDSVGIDVESLAIEWHEEMGLKTLAGMLKDASVSYIAPVGAVKTELPGMLADGKSVDEMTMFVKGVVPESEHQGEALAKALVKVSLAWACAAPLSEKRFEERAEPCMAVMKAICCVRSASLESDEEPNPTTRVQTAVLLETQAWMKEHLAEGKELKPASFIFQTLYDKDIVEEDSFMAWKKDEEVSTALPGKAEAILGSTKFFKWLVEATAE